MFVMVPKLPNVHAPVVELKLLQLKLPVGRKLVRFSTLNTSARNCSRIRSLICVFLIAEMSKLFTCGARIPLNADDSV